MKIYHNIKKTYLNLTVSISPLIFLLILTQSCKKLEIERVVKIKTGDVIDITANSAIVAGIILDAGESGIIQYGHCWSSDTVIPTIDNDKSSLGSKDSVGNYVSQLIDLSENTIYYIRAYASNNDGVVYGDTLTLKTYEHIKAEFAGSPKSGYLPLSVQFTDMSTGDINSWFWNFGDGDTSTSQNPSHIYNNSGNYSVTLTVSNSYDLDSETKNNYITVEKNIINWQKSLGGSLYDEAHYIQQTPDGGYIIAGYSESDNGDVTNNHGGKDYWIVKLTSTGEINWQKSLGGSGQEEANSIQQTIDGGYIIAGYSESNDGDVSGNHGEGDYWIVKLTSTGTINWQKSLGGSGNDWAESIRQTTDGGYITAGHSESNNDDVSGNHGGKDYWIVKLTSTGEIDWQKSLGGSSYDWAKSVRQTTDGGYIVAGYSESNNDDVSGNHGGNDCWIVKLTSAGEIDWQKSLGGSASDEAQSIRQTTDGEYIIAGTTMSNDVDVSGNHGIWDYWIVKLTSTGAIDWQKSLGGDEIDWGSSIQQTEDDGYIVAGGSWSDNGDASENHGGYDYWILKLSPAGQIEWQKSLGGNDWDVAYSIQQTTDSGYIIAGGSTSIDGDVIGNHGNLDYWIVKINEE